MSKQTVSFWFLNISYLSIGLIPPACVSTWQMGGEIRSGLSVSLWGNSDISFSLSLFLPLLVGGATLSAAAHEEKKNLSSLGTPGTIEIYSFHNQTM